jgi:hypothetical protein
MSDAVSAKIIQVINTPVFQKLIPIAGMCFIILFVTFTFLYYTACRRESKETFEDIPTYGAVNERTQKFKKTVDDIYKRVCALDKNAMQSVIVDIETTMNKEIKFTNQADFEKDRPQRHEVAVKKATFLRDDTLSAKADSDSSCDSKDIKMECFDNPGPNAIDWSATDKTLQDGIKRLRVAGIVLFRWISPRIRELGKKGNVDGSKEGFADLGPLDKFFNQCPAKVNDLIVPDISPLVKIRMWNDLRVNEAYMDPIQKELFELEYIQKKLEEMANRFINGTFTADDIAVGTQK